VVVAGIVFGESFTLKQWVGVLLLSSAILSLALVNLYGSEKFQRKELYFALSWAVLAGIMVAAYTTYDAYGIRLTANPFTFLAWFFFLDGILVFPWIALARWQKMEITPQILPLILRGIIGGFIAIFSFGSIMIATRLDSVGEAAVIRETSTVFAAIIGWIFLKETVGVSRAVLMGLIALGAVIVEFGG
jgi:drug/metabolite transporter (DMT)-like permease